MVNVSCDDNILRLAKSPSVWSCSVFAGILSLGLGAAYYGTENIFMKSFFIVGCFVVGASILEDWEDCLFDRNKGIILLNRSNLYQRYVVLWDKRCNVSLNLSSVMAVHVESWHGDNGQIRKRVTMLLTSGASLPLLDGNISMSKCECDLLAEKIRRFLKLNHLESVEFADIEDNYYSDQESSSSETERVPLGNAGRPRNVITIISERR